MQYLMGDFKISERMMRFSLFVPRLYNLCRSYGFEKGMIMPSRAFCSDENQGFPIILITKHFGAFPFNHGMVGGIVATDRHGPYAHHGKDLVIIQASHVGYEPETGQFGTYRWLQVDDKWVPVGNKLIANLFYFKKRVSEALEGRDQLERNLSHSMPRIVTSTFPGLAAAQANTQIEFEPQQ
jgi:hypothetical protein